MKFKVSALIIAMQFAYSACAQNETWKESPIKKFIPDPEIMKGITQKKYKIVNARKVEPAKFSSKYYESVKDECKYLTEVSQSGYLMYGDSITNYLNRLVKRIISSNQMLQGKEYNVFTYRTIIPNAYSYGDGLILFNLDMVLKMKSESEIAYVLCHELSHDFFDHAYKGTIKNFELFYSKEYKRAVRHANGKRYNKAYLKDMIYAKFKSLEMNHSRNEESQADSLGIFLLKSAGYNPYDAISQMNHLDSCDNSIYRDPLPLSVLFNSSAQPFKASWLNQTTSGIKLGSNLSKYELPDSLKSHPDCKDRKIAIERILKNNNFQKIPSPERHSYKYISGLAEREEIKLLVDKDDFGEALFKALNLYKTDTNCVFINHSIVLCLFEIYDAKRKHTLNEIVDTPDEENDGAYNEYLNLIQNINSASMLVYLKEFQTKLFLKHGEGTYFEYISFLLNHFESAGKEIEKEIKKLEEEKKSEHLINRLKRRYNLK